MHMTATGHFKCTKSMPTVFGNALSSPVSAITARNL